MTTRYRIEILRRYKRRGGDRYAFARLKESRTPVKFLRVLIDNADWAIVNNVLRYDEIAREFTPEERLEAGLSDQSNTPLDFSRPVELAGNLWQPLNEGATFAAPYGQYFTYDDAIAAHPHTLPTRTDFENLAKNNNRLAHYYGTWGRVFGDKLFLPASGARIWTTGDLYDLGVEGIYWSATDSSDSTIHAFCLHFYYGKADSNNVLNRGLGLSVRCIMSNHQNLTTMKIIEQGTAPKPKVTRIRCVRCATLFEATSKDAHFIPGSAEESWSLMVSCPICGEPYWHAEKLTWFNPSDE